MASIFKNGKFIEGSSLNNKEYQLFRNIYEKASVLAVELIFKILREYGEVLDFEDFAYIDNLLPKETNYKTWDIEEFKNELDQLLTHYKQRGEISNKYNDVLKVLEQNENLFPFYEEYIRNPD